MKIIAMVRVFDPVITDSNFDNLENIFSVDEKMFDDTATVKEIIEWMDSHKEKVDYGKFKIVREKP